MPAAVNQDFITYAGDDVSPIFTVVDSNNNPIDISSATNITWSAQRSDASIASLSLNMIPKTIARVSNSLYSRIASPALRETTVAFPTTPTRDNTLVAYIAYTGVSTQDFRLTDANGAVFTAATNSPFYNAAYGGTIAIYYLTVPQNFQNSIKVACLNPAIGFNYSIWMTEYSGMAITNLINQNTQSYDSLNSTVHIVSITAPTVDNVFIGMVIQASANVFAVPSGFTGIGSNGGIDTHGACAADEALGFSAASSISINYFTSSSANTLNNVVIFKPRTDVIFVTDGTDGKFQVNIRGSTTANLSGYFVHSATVQDISGNITTVSVGRMQIGLKPSWSYDASSITTTPLYQVRRLIGDTLQGDQQMQDEEITWYISQYSNIYAAASAAARGLAAQFSRMVDTVQGDLRTLYSQRARNYTAMAEQLLIQSKSRMPAAVYAGGISNADKAQQVADTDRVPPQFNIEMFDDLLPTSPVGHQTPGGSAPQPGGY